MKCKKIALISMLFVSNSAISSEITSATAPKIDKNTGVGQKLYESKLGTCHEARDPKSMSQEMMKSQLEKMAPMAGINKKEKRLILDYLLPKAKDAKTN